MTKTCNNCTHAIPDQQDRENWICSAPQTKRSVPNRSGLHTCVWHRMAGEVLYAETNAQFCGREGRWFESKEPK